jgi:hypothetical protein
MRAAAAALLVLLAGCASAAGGAGRAPSDWDEPISVELFPFDAAPAKFVDSKDKAQRTMRVERSADGASARWVLEIADAPAAAMRVTRRDESLFFANGSDAEVELIRGGARPGAAWDSADQRVTFDGWERVTLPGASYEAARITVRRGKPDFQMVETWWFANGVGLVRQRTDRGSLFVAERTRVAE